MAPAVRPSSVASGMPQTIPRPVIGITLGDAAGIGPEVAAAALASGKLDPAWDYRSIGEVPPDVRPGQPTPATARAAWDALEEAVLLTRSGELAAVVTGPICKANMYAEGFAYPGQTEFFAARCAVDNFAMLLTGGALTVALASTHLPLAAAVQQLSTREIVRVGGLLSDFLLRRLKRTVRIGVAGLNPHAGEEGALGREEIERIAPAVHELQETYAGRGVEFAGPLPPDTVFYQAVRGVWDPIGGGVGSVAPGRLSKIALCKNRSLFSGG
jgi:4-hydroxy-L-threonine phosphate dehydrogenase PdxA